MTSADRRPHETCDECGFDAAGWTAQAAAGELRALGARWREVVARTTPDRLRRRPRPDVWSALEYTVHTSFVVRWWREAAARMVAGEALRMDDPTYGDADAHPFNERDPVDAAAELVRELDSLAAFLDGASETDATAALRADDRRVEAMFHEFGIRDAFDGALHALHDTIHHLGDIQAGLGGEVSAPGVGL